MGPDLNTVSLTGEVRKLPDYAQPWSYLEVRICQPDGGVMFLSLHLPTTRWLRLLEGLSPGDRIYAAGELAYARSDRLEGRGGQHCLKVTDLRRLTSNGRLLEAEGLPESLMQLTRPPADGTNPGAVGDRKRRHRKRRAGQGRRWA